MHLMTLGVVNDRGDNDSMIDDRHVWRWSGGCAGRPWRLYRTAQWLYRWLGLLDDASHLNRGGKALDNGGLAFPIAPELEPQLHGARVFRLQRE
jgi:hypothetical protein